MRTLFLGAGLVVLCTTVPEPASADVLDTGEDPSRPPDMVTASGDPTSCRIAWFRDPAYSSPDVERLRNLGHDVTRIVASELALGSLLLFDVVVVAYTEPGLVAEYRDDIQAYVASGHGLLIHQPNHVGLLDYCPNGFDVEIAGVLWCPTGHGVQVTQPTHPMIAGLTLEDFSGAFDTVGALGPAWTVLATSDGCGDPAIAAGVCGAGRVLLETGNAGAQSLDPGSPAYWSSVFSWLSANEPVGVRSVSFGSLKGAYR